MVAVTLAVLGISGGGCSNDDPGSAATSTSIAPPSTLPAGGVYVSAGSSIASGFGIAEQSTACGRSSRSYGRLLATRFKLDLIDVSCGAALIANVVDTPQGENAPQISAIPRDAALITVAVGGNDIVYNGTAVACSDPSTVCTVVLVSYPREIPAGNCPELSLDDSEAAVLRSMGAALEKTFVAVAKETDVVFVDPYAARGDHTGCAPEDERWTAGATVTDGFAFHPTALGHRVMSTMIAAALTHG
jgi:lysophospholipase L1-like esterase